MSNSGSDLLGRKFPRFEILEHTADVRIQSFGHSLEELFENAAHGMETYIFGEERNRERCDDSTAIVLEAGDCDSLLVDWLSEILFLTTTRYQRFTNFAPAISHNGTKLTAQLTSHPATAVEEIKAVTYHELEILEREGRYQVTVTYDI